MISYKKLGANIVKVISTGFYYSLGTQFDTTRLHEYCNFDTNEGLISS